MSQDLHRLVYFSKNRLTMTLADGSLEVASILGVSRTNNAFAGVTGALIFNSGIFAQVLEGSLRDVEATFERIQRDKRHGDVQVLAFEPTEKRSFPSWSMGYVGGSRENEDLFSQVARDSGFDARRMDGERILSLMVTIARDEESRAA